MEKYEKDCYFWNKPIFMEKADIAKLMKYFCATVCTYVLVFICIYMYNIICTGLY